MRVSLGEMEAASLVFLQKLVETLPTTGHKLLAGAMIGTSAKNLRKLFEPIAEPDGTIDTTKLREIIKSGFAASGNRATFTIGDESIKWLLRPVNISVEERDLLDMVTAVESHHS